MKYLETNDQSRKTELPTPKRNIILGIILCIISPVCALAGAGFAGQLGLIIGVLFTVSFFLAGIYQFIGIYETQCPYCSEKVYFKKNTKSYTCKYCKQIGIICEEE